jgi:hypothetical protein
VASKPYQLSAYLAAMRKGKVRAGRRQHVQTIDLVVERYLALGIEIVDEIVDPLGSVAPRLLSR